MTVMANASALLMDTLGALNWAGFYLVRGGRLVLGPFQGKMACIHIERGRGVCGSAWEKDEIIVVPDVHAFPGHIACDSASRSEIVIPLHDSRGVVGVMDLDSPLEGRFGPEDAAGLRTFAKALEEGAQWD